MTLFVLLLASIIGGSNAALVKFTVGQFSPVILVIFRSALAALMILPFFYFTKSSFKIKAKKAYLLLANLLFAANWLFFATGIQYTSVIMSQIIYIPTALIVAILGYLFLKEKLSKNQVFGLVLTLIGMSVLIWGSTRSQDILSFGKPLGNFLIILGLFSWSIYTIVSRKISSIYTPLTITFYNFLISAIFVSLLIPLKLGNKDFMLADITIGGILGLVSIAFFNSVLFFWLYQWVIGKTSAFISSLILYVTPIIAAFTGIIFFGEKLTASLVLASALIMVGVFLATTYQALKINLKV